MYSGQPEEDDDQPDSVYGSGGEEDGSDRSSELDHQELEAMLYSQLHFEQNLATPHGSLSDTSLVNLEFTLQEEDNGLIKGQDVKVTSAKCQDNCNGTRSTSCVKLPAVDNREKLKSSINSKLKQNIKCKAEIEGHEIGKQRQKEMGSSFKFAIEIDSTSDSGVEKGRGKLQNRIREGEVIVIHSDSDNNFKVLGSREKSFTCGHKTDEGVSISSCEESSTSEKEGIQNVADVEGKNQPFMLKPKAESAALIVEDIQINAYQPKFAMDCFDVDNFMDLTLEDIHNSMSDCDWSINPKDRYKTGNMMRYYKTNDLDVTCNKCGKRGHLSKVCPKPKRMPVCILCGLQGHVSRTCPESLCYNCDQPGHTSWKCDQPRRGKYYECHRCNMMGHHKNQCPDIWRQYHLTTKEGPLVKSDNQENKKMCCCNCSGTGHFAYYCNLDMMDRYKTPLLPFVAKYDSPIYVSKHQKAKNCGKRKRSDHRDETDGHFHKKAKLGKKLTSFAKKVKERIKHKLATKDRCAKKQKNKFEELYSGDFPRGKNSPKSEPSSTSGKKKKKGKSKCQDSGVKAVAREEVHTKGSHSTSTPGKSNPAGGQSSQIKSPSKGTRFHARGVRDKVKGRKKSKTATDVGEKQKQNLNILQSNLGFNFRVKLKK